MKRRVLTVGGVARAAGVSEWTVREYAKRNLIPHWVDSAGRRLFDENAIQAVRAVYARRPASRGGTGR
jgi:DNA-binding transcriptional MerR regulator